MGTQSHRACERLLSEIAAEMRETFPYTGRDRLSKGVIEALKNVPREDFVPAGERVLAYANRPLPIGEGQTISQPFIVALMTELLNLAPGSRVLEVGTGSGYQTAVLAELAARVYSIEIVPALAQRARTHLEAHGYANVELRQGNGREGWPEAAPFDAIIVTAAAETIPPALLEQLAPGGRMIVPVGPSGWSQSLLLVEKDAEGEVEENEILPVAFVPLTGKNAG